MEIFERAARAKLRFSSRKGALAAEDLFDLSLESLDQIAKAVNRTLKDSAEESFIAAPSDRNTEAELQLAILRHVISAKQTAAEAAKARDATIAQRNRIEEILLAKKDQELAGKSVEELEALLR